MLKLKSLMLCVMMLPLVVVGCTSKQSVSQCVTTTPPAWMSGLPIANAEQDYFTLRERLITMQKQLERPKYINEQYEWGLPISMGNSYYCEQYTRASSGV